MGRRFSTKQEHAREQARGRSTRRPTSQGGKAVVRPIGRPTGLTERTEETIIGLLVKGNTITDACHLAGIGKSSFFRWMQKGEDAREKLDTTGALSEDEEKFRDFRESVLDAQSQAASKMVDVLFKSAMGGFVTSEEPIVDINGVVQTDPNTGKVLYKRTMTPPNHTAALRYLQAARAKDWSQSVVNADVRVEHTVNGTAGGTGAEVGHDTDEINVLSNRLLEVRQQHEREREERAAAEEAAMDIHDAEIVEEG